jgi:hypothetical protein
MDVFETPGQIERQPLCAALYSVLPLFQQLPPASAALKFGN